MSPDASVSQGSALLRELKRFAQLRWIAGTVTIAGSVIDMLWLHMYPDGWLAAVGVGILVYNAVLLVALQRLPKRRSALLAHAGMQILLDLTCLTVLALMTGGPRSPLLGFFVLHMVFASLLLRRWMAYLTAGAAACMIAAGLLITDLWPDDKVGSLVVAGWVATLLLTVLVANRITHNLRANRRKLWRRNRRIRQMAARLRQQQQAMIQHERMVAMGQMAAGVAHEVANPLANMDSLLQLMRRRMPESQSQLDTLREQIERIRHIVQQLNEFARPDETERRDMPLRDLVDQALAMVQYDHRLRQVHVDCNAASPDVRAVVQPHAIQQVLVNVLMNALDAMSDVADPVLQVQTGQESGWATLHLIDNGHGLDPAAASRVFDPFFTTKPVGHGTGLGLSISYSLLQRQGGRIELANEPSGGTRVTISLPQDYSE